MRKAKKNFLGALGLTAVAATTIYASTLGVPGASAATLSSITDTLQVRVVSPEASVIMSPLQDVLLEAPLYEFNVAYENVSKVLVKLTRVGASSTEPITYTILEADPDFQAGEQTLSIDLTNYGGYGHYILSSEGIDVYGLHVSQQSVELTYASPTTVNPDGSIEVPVPSSPEKPVSSATAYIYDANGNLVATIDIDNPGDVQNINLNDLGLPDGVYTIELVYKDENGDEIPDSRTTITVMKESDHTSTSVDLQPQEEETAKVIVKVVDKTTGEVKKIIEIDNPSTPIDVNVDGLEPGDYEIQIEYYNENGDLIGTSSEDYNKPVDPNVINVPLEPQGEDTAKVRIDIKDENGNVVKTVEVWNPGSNVPVSTDDLPAGDYTADVTYYNGNGDVIGNSSSDFNKPSATDGTVDLGDVPGNVDKVVINVYDPTTGELKKEITIENPQSGNVTIDLDGLEPGDYNVVIDYYDGDTKVDSRNTTTTKPFDGSVVPINIPDGLDPAQAVVVVRDENGNIIKTIVVENPTNPIRISTADLPAGNYTFDTTFYDETGNTIGSTTTNFVKTGNDGSVNLDVPEILDEVETITINIFDKNNELVRYAIVTVLPDGKLQYDVYDRNGNWLRTEFHDRTGNSLSVPMAGLDTGNYGIEIIYKDKDGRIIGTPFTTVISYDAPDDIPHSGAPDTGGLFKNLDVSNVDYLATVLLVFFIFSVVGLGIVLKKRTAKSSKKRR